MNYNLFIAAIKTIHWSRVESITRRRQDPVNANKIVKLRKKERQQQPEDDDNLFREYISNCVCLLMTQMWRIQFSPKDHLSRPLTFIHSLGHVVCCLFWHPTITTWLLSSYADCYLALHCQEWLVKEDFCCYRWHTTINIFIKTRHHGGETAVWNIGKIFRT